MRYHTIIQHDERDCGAACLSMIATHYGLKYPISKYRELTKTDHIGTNLYGLCDAASQIGLKAEALSGNLKDLSDSIKSGEVKFPFIAHIINEDYMQHFVVVFGIKKNQVIVGDPGRGMVKYTYAQFEELWNGYIVAFEKTENFVTGNYQKGSISKFFGLLKGQYTKLISIIILSLVISAIGIVGAYVFEIVIDKFYTINEVVECDDGCEEEHQHTNVTEVSVLDNILNTITRNKTNFNLFFVCLIGLYFLQSVIGFLRGYLISHISKEIDIKLILPYYSHTIKLPMQAINGRNTGEYLSRFSDASAVRDAISGATLTLLLDSIMVVGCGVILYLENSKMFYVSLIVIVLYAIVVLLYRKPLENVNRKVMENNARVQSYLKESIDGIETLKSHRAESCAEERHYFKFRRFITAVFKDNILSFSQESVCNLIEFVGVAVILWLGFGLVSADEISIGSLVTFYALLAYFTEPIKNLISLQPKIQTAVIAAQRLNDVLDIATEQITEENDKLIKWNEIKFTDVDFRYGNHALVLKDISFQIKKGERVAIVGESGSGKTTLAKLLLRFYEQEKGEISVDGISLNEISLKQIRDSISYVDQNTFLFSDTIKNNLILGQENISEQKLIEICEATKVDEFVKGLALGYDTFLDENGKVLSGGQRQRLAIARALLREPELIVFDEATSNLDTITEGAIRDTIFNLNKEMTCIIIAHRLSTIKNCDKIVVMEKGEIVEIGTHQELLEKKGKYFDLYNRQ